MATYVVQKYFRYPCLLAIGVDICFSGAIEANPQLFNRQTRLLRLL
jgi:hypothetical protein